MILWFSGTGNTLQVAQVLAGELDEPMVRMDVRERRPCVPMQGRRVVWCFPTYSWGVPPVVVRFMKNVRIDGAGRVPHYMVTTCGDDMGYADRQWRRLVRSRQWQSAGAYSVVMPNVYVLMKGFEVDPGDVAADKLRQAPGRIHRIAEAIERGGADVLVRGSFPLIKSLLIYPWFRRFAMSPRHFRSTAGCTGCGSCARSCPLGNISMAGGRPHWGSDCALCLRCYHQCPQRAVAYGSATDGKGQYLNACMSQRRQHRHDCVP